MSVFKNEEVFNGEVDVKYLFQKSYTKTDGLVIVFSAFQAEGKPANYNYVRTLEEFDCNKLYILDDFGEAPSYYLCNSREFSIERSVIALIRKIVKENEISKIISSGSSKGGFAALYYGIKYGFDHVISASPQYLLGDYLLEQAEAKQVGKKVVEFISGGTEAEDHEYLNNIMASMIRETKNNPDIFIHLGVGEHHYRNHVIPMIKLFDEIGIAYELNLGSYDKHSDVLIHFPPLLKEKIRELLKFPLISLEQINREENKQDTLYEFKVTTEMKNKVAWYVYKDNKIIDKFGYAKNKTIKLSFKEKGKYMVKVFVKNEGNLKVSTITNSITV
ncbi:hypothetical protein [Bacillus niameyensis]|uniref:hypothetical protein n=1 Tax=Bacillus niameyensis TaxID=1522308 RepID=UPI00078208B4|nr:hypothetical protein [Bacillus niameyensis]